jgi:hypothetical protein
VCDYHLFVYKHVRDFGSCIGAFWCGAIHLEYSIHRHLAQEVGNI